jgi:hypothetical protein
MSGFLYNVPTAAASVQSIYSLTEQITFPINATTTNSIVIGDALPGYGDSYNFEFVLTCNGSGSYNIEIENSEDRIYIASLATGPGLTECRIKIAGTRGFAGDDTACIFWALFVANNDTTLVQRVDMNMALNVNQDIDITITCPVGGTAFISWANAFKIIAP